MRFWQDRSDDGPRLDLTPMVDVMLQLIIFFVLTSSFIRPGLKVDLPKGVPELTPKEKKEMVITITKENRLYFGKKEMSLGDLESLFLQKAQEAPDTLIVINADRRAFHGTVVEVMELAKRSGLKNFAILTEPKR